MLFQAEAKPLLIPTAGDLLSLLVLCFHTRVCARCCTCLSSSKDERLTKIKLCKLSQVGRRENCYLKLIDNVAALWASLNRKQQGEIREHRCVLCYIAMKALCDMRIENLLGKGEYI